MNNQDNNNDKTQYNIINQYNHKTQSSFITYEKINLLMDVFKKEFNLKINAIYNLVCTNDRVDRDATCQILSKIVL